MLYDSDSEHDPFYDTNKIGNIHITRIVARSRNHCCSGKVKVLSLSPALLFNGRRFQRTKIFELNKRVFILSTLFLKGTAVAQWLKCCATNRKVAGSIPVGVIGNLH